MNYKYLPKEHKAYCNFNDLPETTKAYWAGLLDGEGCIRLEKNGKVSYPKVTLKMTCEKTVKAFADLLNVNYSKRGRTGMKEHWKDCYSSKVTTQKASKFCEAILPYLITKKEIAGELSKYYLRNCENCNERFWTYNDCKSCSSLCVKERKYKVNKEARQK